MRTRIMAAALTALLFSGCGAKQAEPLRGWDGEIVTVDEDGGSSIPIPIEEPEPEDGWLNPVLAHKVTAPGSRLLDIGRVQAYESFVPNFLVGCESIARFSIAEETATVEAWIYRGTREVRASAGEDGTLLEAHAISFADPDLVEGYAQDLTNTFLMCGVHPYSAELVTHEIDDLGTVDVVHVFEDGVPSFRSVALTRQNILLQITAIVDEEDEAMFDAFVTDASLRLNRAPFEDEFLAEDTDT